MSARPTTTAALEPTEVSLRGLLRDLHALWTARLLEPTDRRLQIALEDVTDALMIGAAEVGLDPHRWCPDRYCDCHLTLWIRHPQLLQLDALGHCRD